MRIAPIILLLGSLLSPSVLAAKLEFKSYGDPVQKLSLGKLKKIKKRKKLTVYDPNALKELTFYAIPAKAILDEVYGEDWRNAEEVLFTCSDGYQPSYPVSYFKDFEPYFAYAMAHPKKKGKKKRKKKRKNKKKLPPFSIVIPKRDNLKVDLGPFYLIWENKKQKHPRVKDWGIWAYQIVGLDLVDFADRFPRLSPPEGAEDQVQQGFLSFRTHCMNCHMINGQGGKVAADLNWPKNTVDVRGEKWLASFIDNPKKVLPGTEMNELNSKEPNRDQVIKNIVAYLKAMKDKQLGPEPTPKKDKKSEKK